MCGVPTHVGKMRVPDVRVRAMKDYVKPTSQKGLRTFLGMAGYYRRFVPDFTQWTGPLFGVLKRESPVKIEWEESMRDAFVYLTNALSCEHTLIMHREHDQLLVQTDASRVQWSITRNSYIQRRKTTRSLSSSVWW